jgi:hypothetical protein
MRRLVPFLLLLLLFGCAEPVVDCRLSMVASVPLQPVNRLLTVPIGINGQWARLIVDTGAERTTLSRDAVARLHLSQDPRFVARSIGIGGASTNADAIIERLVIGGVRFPLGRVAVGDLKLDGPAGPIADGLLGADILLAFEMDVDAPGGALSLYHVRRCPDARPAWKQPAVEVAGVSARKDRLMIPFELDGTGGIAILDTGAEQTVVGARMATRMGLTAERMLADPSLHHRGAGPNVMTAKLHRFGSLRVGPAIIAEPWLSVLPSDLVGDALLGQDFLRGRRVWMSFPTRRFFISPLAHETGLVRGGPAAILDSPPLLPRTGGN